MRNFLLTSLFGLFFMMACGPGGGGGQLQTSALEQSQCKANSESQELIEVGKEGTESFEVSASGDQIQVMYKSAPFRCEQDVTWAAAQDGMTVTLTVRPKVMKPDSVARCNCRYDLGVKVGPLGVGKYNLKIKHQTDEYAGASVTKDVHSAEVEIK